MTNRVILEPVFILHSRPFSNTSLIVDMFTMRHGRVSALARSARGPKSRYRGKLQPFVPLLASWTGTRDLKNLGNVEFNGSPYFMNGNTLLCAFYINELLVLLLHHEDSHQQLFELYQNTLNRLQKTQQLQQTLRYFEKHLLNELGYGLPLHRDAYTGEAIDRQRQYQYVPEHGFVHCEHDSIQAVIFSGDVLLALHEEALLTDDHMKQAKRLMRLVLTHHLGDKPIKSRELLV